MKMVKSLLLGTAAGLVVVTAGQAAELPVKAAPVEYVKICTLYGAGFYYMPGTDMCLKIGGWVRAEVSDPINGNFANGPFSNNTNTRATNNLTVRARGYITADAREMTPYGVARAYIDVGLSTNTVGLELVIEHVQLQPRLPAMGRLHRRPVAVVLRLLQCGGAELSRRLFSAGRHG